MSLLESGANVSQAKSPSAVPSATKTAPPRRVLRIKQPSELNSELPTSKSPSGHDVTSLWYPTSSPSLYVTLSKNKEQGERKIAHDLSTSLKRPATMMTVTPPQTTRRGQKPKEKIMWVHLQASICTEWEQSSMVLTPESETGARVTTESAGDEDKSTQVSSLLEVRTRPSCK